jgi:hypothetical protein
VVIQGNNATILSKGFSYPDEFHSMALSAPFAEFAYPASDTSSGIGECRYTMTVYPTAQFEALFVTKNPSWYVLVVLAIFVFTSLASLFLTALFSIASSI